MDRKTELATRHFSKVLEVCAEGLLQLAQHARTSSPRHFPSSASRSTSHDRSSHPHNLTSSCTLDVVDEEQLQHASDLVRGAILTLRQEPKGYSAHTHPADVALARLSTVQIPALGRYAADPSNHVTPCDDDLRVDDLFQVDTWERGAIDPGHAVRGNDANPQTAELDLQFPSQSSALSSMALDFMNTTDQALLSQILNMNSSPNLHSQSSSSSSSTSPCPQKTLSRNEQPPVRHQTSLGHPPTPALPNSLPRRVYREQILAVDSAHSRASSVSEPDPDELSETQAGRTVKKRARRRWAEVERRYACDMCPKVYGSISHLNTHITAAAHGRRKSAADYAESEL